MTGGRSGRPLAALGASLLSLGIGAPSLTAQPGDDAYRIVTSDLENFWRAWDRAATAETWDDSVAAFEALYREQGSEGLADFFGSRIEDVPTLLREIRSAPRYYAALRPQTPRVQEFVPEIHRMFADWLELYPEADLPDVFFVIGRRTSGGTTSAGRLLIGTEMYGRTPDTPDEELSDWQRDVLAPIDRIPAIVAHELIHTQQRATRPQTLLGRVIQEGMCDFLGELISGLNINAHVHEWADARAAELWADFREVMGERETNAGWLYGARSEDEPADLGYWLGYRITEAYYEKAGDRGAAIREILTIQDYEAFLEASAYDGGG
ncbi:MAG: DUF2268 domain-containing putative Zn-dependent protease [Gemmatimonadota bacterium]|nr:DUF2268 domain-containing putative Zn-dependent protease [Gemmatimonadota bacterium]